MSYIEPEHILIIDDDEINNFIAERLIKRVSKDTRITICRNGHDALVQLSTIQEKEGIWPKFIFLDLTMSVMDGWEFLESYRKLNEDQTNDTRVVIVTSSVFRHDMDRAREHPVESEYIIKPLTSERLFKLFAT
ncbi:response regulator [Mucilaginibacter sabulilitoris]|uniref:Response regulator n=1 Tax=Mucilaginibacter sabulilitoris TaxID=1173583 RepID=A0ABZ0TRX6_9SPHI|nr:response regulator [Mucilaginibacter sabulilitoris]WPU95664.1 response regulator [Mucilaginibacter sabulilitoris]